MATSTFASTRDKIENQPVQPQEPVIQPTEEKAAQPQVPDIVPAAAPTEPAIIPEVKTDVNVVDDESAHSQDFNLELSNIELGSPENKNSTPTFSIDEEIKKLDKKELLKKAGVSDFIIEFEEHISNGGSGVDYLQAKAIDYTSVSDEDLIKSDLKKQYPNLSQQQIDIMFNRSYGVNEDSSEEDREFALAKLSADGYRIRQAKIDEQKRFKIQDPISVSNPEYEEWKQSRENAQKQYEESVNYFNNHSATKSLIESKKVVIDFGDGVKPFNFRLNNPELITKAMTDDGTIMQKILSTETGEPDVAKQQLVTLFAFNPKSFIQAIYDYGAAMGTRKKLVEDNQNAQRPSAPVLPISPDAKPVFRNSTFGQIRNG